MKVICITTKCMLSTHILSHYYSFQAYIIIETQSLPNLLYCSNAISYKVRRGGINHDLAYIFTVNTKWYNNQARKTQ